jgi:uncharacterized protein YbjT (DUF2867 family)
MRIAVAGATGRVGRHVVKILAAQGHDVVSMSRSTGVDVISGDGLAEALTGDECLVDLATGPSPDERQATEFFTTSARNLHGAGRDASVRRMIVVSIIAIDRFASGYYAAKLAQERLALAGPIPVRILRAARFLEFVGLLVDRGRQGDVSYVSKMRTQLVAARTVAPRWPTADRNRRLAQPEIAGPRVESMDEAARLLKARSGNGLRIEASRGTSASRRPRAARPGLDARGPDVRGLACRTDSSEGGGLCRETFVPRSVQRLVAPVPRERAAGVTPSTRRSRACRGHQR